MSQSGQRSTSRLMKVTCLLLATGILFLCVCTYFNEPSVLFLFIGITAQTKKFPIRFITELLNNDENRVVLTGNLRNI